MDNKYVPFICVSHRKTMIMNVHIPNPGTNKIKDGKFEWEPLWAPRSTNTWYLQLEENPNLAPGVQRIEEGTIHVKEWHPAVKLLEVYGEVFERMDLNHINGELIRSKTKMKPFMHNQYLYMNTWFAKSETLDRLRGWLGEEKNRNATFILAGDFNDVTQNYEQDTQASPTGPTMPMMGHMAA